MSKNRISFRPRDYSSSSLSRKEERDVKEKGNGYHIDLTKVESVVAYLRNYASLKLRELPAEVNEKFAELTNFYTIMYNTTYYDQFRSILSKYFSNLEKILPGTIGAYCYGCFVSNNGCSPICAGSIQSSDTHPSFCDYTVIIAERSNSDSFTFVLKHKGTISDTAYVYVSYLSYNAFPGFSESEKSKLSTLGVSKVILCGYSTNGNNYVEFSNEAIPVDKIKERVSIVSMNSSFGDYSLLIVLIIVLLIGIFFAWRYWSYR
jgi:hypothetical protein